MSFLKLTFKPGVNRDQTNYTGEGGWYAMNRVRFRSTNPQQLGGWIKGSLFVFQGICRELHNWITTFHDNLMAIGTNVKLYIEFGGNAIDITPLRETLPVIGPPDTDNGVYVYAGENLADFGTTGPINAEVGQYVTISGVVGPIGGVPASELNGNHKIIMVLGGTGFRIATTTTPTSTVAAAGGTAITFEFEIPPGFATAVNGYGWGTGTWGRGTWGSGSTSPIALPQRDWWYDNIDNDLVANIRNGPIYYWTRGIDLTPPANRAVLLSSLAAADGYDPDAVPSKVMQVIISQQDRHLLAFGAVPLGQTDPATFDPLLIRWADQDNWTQWTPTPLNSAGFLRVSRGSKIVRALPTRQEFLVWTDSNLYTLQFLGTTDVYGLQEYADNISIIGPRAVITAANITYWMGDDKFYRYTGRVETQPCTLNDLVFEHINKAQAEQVVCGTNEHWNEVWWFYPSDGSLYNNSYVIYNYVEDIWYYGFIDRTAWLDTPLRMNPFAIRPVPVVVPPATPENPSPATPPQMEACYLIRHEYGMNDDTVPMKSFLLSNDFDLGDGEQFMLTRRMVPDFTFKGSVTEDPVVMVQLLPRNFPGSQPFPDVEDTQGIVAKPVGTYTQQVFFRARARSMAMKIMCDQLDVQWELGTCRLDARLDGRR